MSARTDVRVLIAGDGEADLQRLGLIALPSPPQHARGVPAAVAAMRLSDFGVVVADVACVEDALALLRAAGRGRPEAATIVLFPADFPDLSTGMDLVYRSAFAVRRHPIGDDELGSLVERAARTYQSVLEAGGLARERGPWAQAEQVLATALSQAAARWGGPSAAQEAEPEIIATARAATRSVRARGEGPGVVIELARVLSQAGESSPREVGGAA